MNGYNFTERVRKVLAMAREEAARLHHEYVGTEHILLGLIREGEGVAAAVLQNLSIDLDEIQQKIEEQVKKGKATQATGPDLPYTSRAKKVLELAMSEARELNHSYVGTEHLLLSLLREEKGVAAQVLSEAGLHLDAARAETLRLLGGGVNDAQELPRAAAGGGGGVGLRSVPVSPARARRMPSPTGAPNLGALEARRLEAEAEKTELETAWMHIQYTIGLGGATGTPVRLDRTADGVLWLVLGDNLMRVRVPGSRPLAPQENPEERE